MWATRDQFYKCWRKQRLKIEEKERWILMLSSFTFQQEQGKKDRSKLLTWLKMTYNNRVLPSTLLRILLRSGSVDKTTSERKTTKSLSVSSVLHWLSYFHFRRWFFLLVPDWASQVAFRFCLCIPPCDHFCARLQRADCWHIFSLLPIHWKRETPYIQIQMNRNSTHHKASCSCMHPAESNAGYVNSNKGAALIRQAGRPSRHNEKDQPPHEAQIQGPEIWKYF